MSFPEYVLRDAKSINCKKCTTFCKEENVRLETNNQKILVLNFFLVKDIGLINDAKPKTSRIFDILLPRLPEKVTVLNLSLVLSRVMNLFRLLVPTFPFIKSLAFPGYEELEI